MVSTLDDKVGEWQIASLEEQLSNFTCEVRVQSLGSDGACTVISKAERQARWGAKREAEIEALRAAIIKAELARTQAENYLLRQRVLDLETVLAHRESAAK